MAYYHIEDLGETEPPPAPEAEPEGLRKEDHAAWKRDADRRHKVHMDEHKVRVKKMEARGSEASRFLMVVVHSATGKIVCSCEGKQQAEYISELLNDRPHA